MNIKLLYFLLCFLVGSLALQKCKGENPSTGIQYDFTPLVLTDDSWKSIWQQYSSEYVIQLNPCNQVGGSTPCTDDCSVCQVYQNSYWCLGSANKKDFVWSDLTSDFYGTEGVTLQISGGEFGRNTNVSFVCNENAGPGFPYMVGEAPADVTYQMIWNTMYACSNN